MKTRTKFKTQDELLLQFFDDLTTIAKAGFRCATNNNPSKKSFNITAIADADAVKVLLPHFEIAFDPQRNRRAEITYTYID